MSDKPNLICDTSFTLPDISVIALSGRDAAAFAQAQFMNDVDALADATWQWSGWLSPKGRVIALFALLRRDIEFFYVLLHDADPDAFIASLKRFIFRSKVQIMHVPTLGATGALRAPARAHGRAMDMEGDSSELDVGTPADPRSLRVAPRAGEPDDADFAAHWRGMDMRHGLPRLPPGQAEAWTPHQLSLERLQAFSVKKGCYPGQEIVARTHFLGRAPRGLVGLQGAGDAAPGDEVLQGTQAIGRLASVSPSIQLAVLPLTRGDEGLSVGGASVVEVPLRDGLAR